MKKILLLVAIAVFGLTGVNAQEFSYGVKGGLNLANIAGDTDGFEQDARLSLNLGAVGKYMISDLFSIQAELLYSGQGFKQSDVLGSEDLVFALDYINLPILADITIAEGLSLQGGPQIGFLISDKAKFDGESVDLSDEGFDASTLDLSAAIGVQYKLPNNGLFFQARYAHGISNIIEEDGESIQNSVFNFSVGYFFK